MAKRNLPKRLFKAPDRVSSYHHDRSPMGRMKRMAREHEDVLQNIEFALVNGHLDDPGIDDRAVIEALQVSLTGSEPDDERVDGLVMALRAIRQFREDIDDAVWRGAIHVVADSVRRHSALRPGETSYLSFVAEYVK